MGIDIKQRGFFPDGIQKHLHQYDMFQNIGMIARMKSVPVTEHGNPLANKMMKAGIVTFLQLKIRMILPKTVQETGSPLWINVSLSSK